MKSLRKVLICTWCLLHMSFYPQYRLVHATLLCRHVWRSCACATLLADRIYWKVCRHIGSATSPHLNRLSTVSKRSYTDLIMEQSRRDVMTHILFHVSDRCKAPTQAVHWPCLSYFVLSSEPAVHPLYFLFIVFCSENVVLRILEIILSKYCANLFLLSYIKTIIQAVSALFANMWQVRDLYSFNVVIKIREQSISIIYLQFPQQM